MRILTDILLSLVQLGEAEARSLKKGAQQLLSGFVLELVAGLVGVFAIIMMVLSAFWAIQTALGLPIAALLTGVIALVITGALVGITLWRNRS